MSLFSKNPSLDAARKALKSAQLGLLKAQQDLDWAESMVLYYNQRQDSLKEFIAQSEAIESEPARAAESALEVAEA